jgi:uncharacterized protein (TIGR01777 family)
MNIVVTGASGLLGGKVLERLRGHAVTAVSRRTRTGGDGIAWVQGDIAAAGSWQRAVEAADAVIHLAGEPLADKRWSPARKESLRASRIESTRRVVEAMGRRPAVLVCASATGFYGPRGEEPLDEDAGPGADFLSALCQEWEAEARAATDRGVRTVCLRFGVVLSRRGGALARMLPAFKLFVGGPLGDPHNWFPWIHEDDAAGLVAHALATPTLAGPVNAVAPGRVRMAEFARTLGRVLGRPALMPVPLPALRLMLGELAEAINPGQMVIPRAALAAGYHFVYEGVDSALVAALA